MLLAVLIMGNAAMAQNKDAKKPTATKAAPAPAAKPEAKPAGKMKKDGTPDMRYKENKAAAKPAGPTKKDGTPDMRYKANKTDAAKKK